MAAIPKLPSLTHMILPDSVSKNLDPLEFHQDKPPPRAPVPIVIQQPAAAQQPTQQPAEQPKKKNTKKAAPKVQKSAPSLLLQNQQKGPGGVGLTLPR